MGLFPGISAPSVFGRKITDKRSEVRSSEQQSGLPSSNPKWLWAARSEKTIEKILCNYEDALFYWSKYL